MFYLNRNISDKQQEISPKELREKLRKQLEYYFSRENLLNDIYLQSQMDSENFVPISLIANFKLVKRLTEDFQLIIDVLKESSLVEVDKEEKKVRSFVNKIDFSKRKRCIIILRNVPFDATENEILFLFSSIKPIDCEKILDAEHSDCWYVTFQSEDDAQTAFLYLTRENLSIRGQKILGRIKTRLWQKPRRISSNFFTFSPQEFLFRQQQFPIVFQTNNNFLLNSNYFQQTQFLNRFILPTNYYFLPTLIPFFSSKTKSRISTLKIRKPTTKNSNEK